MLVPGIFMINNCVLCNRDHRHCPPNVRYQICCLKRGSLTSVFRTRLLEKRMKNLSNSPSISERHLGFVGFVPSAQTFRKWIGVQCVRITDPNLIRINLSPSQRRVKSRKTEKIRILYATAKLTKRFLLTEIVN